MNSLSPRVLSAWRKLVRMQTMMTNSSRSCWAGRGCSRRCVRCCGGGRFNRVVIASDSCQNLDRDRGSGFLACPRFLHFFQCVPASSALPCGSRTLLAPLGSALPACCIARTFPESMSHAVYSRFFLLLACVSTSGLIAPRGFQWFAPAPDATRPRLHADQCD